MFTRLAKLLGLPSPAVLIAILIALALPLLLAAVQTTRHSAASAKVGQVQAEKKLANRRADTAEQTLTQTRETQAKADVAAASEVTRQAAAEDRTTSQKGEVDDLQKQHGSRPVSDLTRAHLERVRSRQAGR